jgi:hypothetical protein
MSLKTSNVPAMPTLAMLGDNGGVVTVNPEWCDWYELVFNVPAGEGYIKGKEIMHQIDGAFSEFFVQRSEAMKSAIHAMVADDPNSPGTRYRSIEEARKSFTLIGKHAMDYDHKEEVFTFDGYFSVTDLEAILFIHRAEELIGKAKKRFGDFLGTAGNNTEKLDVNQLMQVMQPSLEPKDVDSQIFATPVAESSNRAYMFPKAKPSAFADLPKEAHDGYADRAVGITEQRMSAHLTSPMAEQFNSVVEAHAALTESGILSQNLSRAVNGSFHIEGYFTPKDLEAILYLYRNNDPMVFPKQDANGLPKDNSAVKPLYRKSFMELLGVTDTSSSDEVAAALCTARIALTEHYKNRPNQSIDYLAGATSTRKVPTGMEIDPTALSRNLDAETVGLGRLSGTPRSVWCSLSSHPAPEGFDLTPPEMTDGDVLHRTHILSNDCVLHIAYDRNGDQAFYQCTKQGNLVKAAREPKGTRGRTYMTTEEKFVDGMAGLLSDALENPGSAAKALRRSTGDDLKGKLTAEIVGGGLRRGEWPGEVSARTAINRTTIVGGTRIHCFEPGDDDFPMLSALLKKLETFDEQFVDLKLAYMRIAVAAPWAEDGVTRFEKGDGFFTLVLEKTTGAVVELFSLKATEYVNQPDQIVVFEHDPETVNYDSISALFEVFNNITPEDVAAAKEKALKLHGE